MISAPKLIHNKLYNSLPIGIANIYGMSKEEYKHPTYTNSIYSSIYEEVDVLPMKRKTEENTSLRSRIFTTFYHTVTYASNIILRYVPSRT